MGKQLLLHMLQEDKDGFFAHLASRHALNATIWTSSLPTIILDKTPEKEDRMLALWPASSGYNIKRVKVLRNNRAEVFEFDRNVPILEWMPSKLVEHGSKPGLLQGRLYLFAPDEDVETGAVLRTATCWAKKAYEPCPVKSFGGYIGPAAMQWFKDGGLLLPTFNPPPTADWEKLFGEQDRTY